MRAFISYSHKDAWALERLHAHLAVLRREGAITEWYDREILAGGDVDREISNQLERCDLLLALVSADFLASNYCYEREMQRAIERHESGSTRVIPIIVEPCDWKSSPLKRFKALPRDGKPITEWANQNNAYLDVVVELRRLIPARTAEVASTKVAIKEGARPLAAERKYRMKRDFDEIDKGNFRRTAFETIHEYFRASINEIDSIDGIKARFEDIERQGFTCTILNQALKRSAAHITVYAGGRRVGLGDVYYSFAENAPPNTANGSFDIVSDEYDLFLEPGVMAQRAKERLSPDRAATMLWTEFLEKAGITHE